MDGCAAGFRHAVLFFRFGVMCMLSYGMQVKADYAMLDISLGSMGRV